MGHGVHYNYTPLPFTLRVLRGQPPLTPLGCNVPQGGEKAVHEYSASTM